MPVSGPKPKDADRKVTRHGLTHDWVEVPNVPYAGDKPTPGGRRLPAMTARWWASVSSMPHCVLWEESDWQFALDTLQVHRRFASTGEGAAELRQREKVLGTTVDSRRDLRIRYVEPVTARAEGEDAPAVTDFAAERRRRLAGGGDANAD